MMMKLVVMVLLVVVIIMLSVVVLVMMMIMVAVVVEMVMIMMMMIVMVMVVVVVEKHFSLTWGRASATVSSNFRIPSAVFSSFKTIRKAFIIINIPLILKYRLNLKFI